MHFPPLTVLTTDDYERQRQHLEEVYRRKGIHTRPPERCLHNACPECHGTGVRRDGSPCVHSLSCPCPRCSPGRML